MGFVHPGVDEILNFDCLGVLNPGRGGRMLVMLTHYEKKTGKGKGKVIQLQARL